MEKLQFVPFQNVDINAGFWQKRQKLNSTVTVRAVYDRFKDTGRFDSLNFNWYEGQPNKPHIFWDSDIAKWIESVAFILEKEENKELEAIVDDTVDLIEKYQRPDGYYNIWFTVVEPSKRWHGRTEHELYCAGHLMEAAVAYYNATKKDKFLKLMCKYADYIEQVFVIEKSALFTTPGHEEIELALVKMYHATGEKRYLALSRFFLDNRGCSEKDKTYTWGKSLYAQDHLPVREQTTGEGHSVRAVYLYCGMADLALEIGDVTLYNACEKIFDNIVNRRMYITGGIGSSTFGEAFTIDYDLPNLTAYSESCAAIGLAMFARRMSVLSLNAKYADIIERVLYNGFLSSQSLDGKAFFYENPLEVSPELTKKDASVNEGVRFPTLQRQEVFDCSCCPPNITRFMASIGDYLYNYSESVIYVNQYINSKTTTSISGNNVSLTQETIYPRNGLVKLNVSGWQGKTIAVRIPSWCSGYALTVDGVAVTPIVKEGYAYIDVANQNACVEINFAISIVLIESNPYVQENSGRVALTRGPIVYCLEGVDNGKNLRDIRIGDLSTATTEYDEFTLQDTIIADGYRRDVDAYQALYQPAGSNYISQKLRFVPYFSFANRGISEMIVWVLR